MSAPSNYLPSRLHNPGHIPIGPCPNCRTPLEFLPPAGCPPFPATPFHIQCFSCSRVLAVTIPQHYAQAYQQAQQQGRAAPAQGQAPSPPSSTAAQEQYQAQQRQKKEEEAARRGGRKIGTQERPLDMLYYDTLGVPASATTDDIKKAYRRLAIKHHPDKNRDDPTAEETFKQIAIAYQVLSDPELRKKYNEFGPKEGAPEGGYVDPEEVFSAIFGGERFAPIIGEISLGREMKEALQQADDETGAAGGKGKELLSPEEKAKKEEKDRLASIERAKAREARVQKLVENLERKLAIYTESAYGVGDRDVGRSWREICQIEAEELKQESYGVDLLHAVGFVYAAKSRQYLASTTTFMGVGGWLHNVQGKYHIFSETVSTVRSALELKQVFEQLAAAEKSGASAEERKKLEEQAAEKGLQALFKGTKLEIDSVIRETCDRVLSAPGVPREKLSLRAYALQILGEAYLAVKKDDAEGGAGVQEDEYVRVDTKASKERERQGTPPR
ncbi:hypothetical protein BOTBODRAFT_116749 [Botryobasidium botryosum FD-172 SS1]|uniref:J domain-containing protein n=1 Tax=Botryobasidium botryosum (strain FD-172 SS1) TaxID=930990 RepID=A0A067MDN4_BOTB1|nr:hypothetical protein BOTBODRAFT_116749 [Botryobasidium botryosum FD-172 SS1]